jgi:biopolymer transport protein ExbD
MKIRKGAASGSDKVDINMTPMIDVVFQLLSFFVMSFKIVSQEGDFNVRMPIAAPREGLPDENLVPPLKVRMRAGAGGQLADIALNGNQLGTSIQQLHNEINSIVGNESPTSRESYEVELDCDYDLRYEYVVQAITAVSGYKQGDQIVKLVEKIKFAPPRPSGAGG